MLQDVGIAEQQKVGEQGKAVDKKQQKQNKEGPVSS